MQKVAIKVAIHIRDRKDLGNLLYDGNAIRRAVTQLNVSLSFDNSTVLCKESGRVPCTILAAVI